jgi:hypothetical protein
VAVQGAHEALSSEEKSGSSLSNILSIFELLLLHFAAKEPDIKVPNQTNLQASLIHTTMLD